MLPDSLQKEPMKSQLASLSALHFLWIGQTVCFFYLLRSYMSQSRRRFCASAKYSSHGMQAPIAELCFYTLLPLSSLTPLYNIKSPYFSLLNLQKWRYSVRSSPPICRQSLQGSRMTTLPFSGSVELCQTSSMFWMPRAVHIDFL